ncbi:MAG: hypothetical protein QW548_03275 [Candidatus Aenigmatarchaeota archaeon]
MLREIIGNPVYLIFLLLVLAVVAALVIGMAVQGRDIGQWIFGYIRTVFGG